MVAGPHNSRASRKSKSRRRRSKSSSNETLKFYLMAVVAVVIVGATLYVALSQQAPSTDQYGRPTAASTVPKIQSSN